jgi:hypothetical protein
MRAIIERALNPNCSEAVFRFYTDQPQMAHEILQAFANEVARANEHPAQIIRSLAAMEDVKKVSFLACAGVRKPRTKCHWEPELKAFVLCIGNNDISPDGEGCETVRKLGIKVEEAETCPSVRKYARDCTCGAVFFEEQAQPVSETLPATAATTVVPEGATP